MAEQQDPRWKILTAFALVYVIWGSTYLGIRYAIQTIPPLLMAGTRFLVAGALLYLYARRVKEKIQPVHWKTAAVLGVFLLLFGNGCVTLGEETVPSGLAALLIASEPLWLVLLDWIRPAGRAPNGMEIGGLLLGFTGVGFLVAPTNGISHVNPVGAGLVLFSALAWAIGSIYSLGAPQPKSGMLANSMTMLAGGAIQILAGLALGEHKHLNLNSISGTSVMAMSYLVVAGSLIGFSAYAYLLRVTTPAKASTYAFVNPVVAVLLGWLIAGEPLTERSLGAMGAVVAAVVLITRARSGHAEIPKKAETAAAPAEEESLLDTATVER